MLRFLLVADEDSAAAARLLDASVRAHHPDAELTWLLTDPRPSGLSGPWERSDTSVVEGRRRAVGSMRATELWMALSPRAARWALLPGVVAELIDPDRSVVVLPASAEVLGSLDEMVVATGSGAGLVPRRYDAESGVASGGWLAEVGVFGPDATPFLRWWEAVAEDLARQEEVDDDWWGNPWSVFCESAPTLRTIGAPATRLAPETAAQIPLALAPGPTPVVEAEGTPVALVSFADFDPQRPWWFATADMDRPQVSTSSSPALRHLCRTRAERLRAAGWRPPRPAEILPGLPHRRGLSDAYRRGVAAAGTGGGPLPPNPFDVGGAAAYLDWLREHADDGPTGTTRFADAVWVDRPDLAGVFPHVRWSHREAFQRWTWTSGLSEGATDVALLEPISRSPAVTRIEQRPVRPGLNVIGYHGAELGLGVVARRMGRALDAAGIPWVAVDYDRTSSRRRGGPAGGLDLPYSTHLVIATADQLPLVVGDLGSEVFDGRYTIGMWFWETDTMPSQHRRSFALVDEVWGATGYLRDVFTRYTDRPVVRVPVPLEFEPPPSRADARSTVGFDDRFTYLFSFDFLSVSERKNPHGLVGAYLRAYPTPGGTRLVLKSINGDQFPAAKERLLDAIADRPDIESWDHYLDGPERLALVAAADCYVSLHRSEGLGLTMAEAMAAGTPVVASAYSGNLDFMDANSALLVSGREVEIGEGCYYPAEGHWFDPDLDDAARLLRVVRDDERLRARLAAAGPYAVARFGAREVGATIRARLDELWGEGPGRGGS